MPCSERASERARQCDVATGTVIVSLLRSDRPNCRVRNHHDYSTSAVGWLLHAVYPLNALRAVTGFILAHPTLHLSARVRLRRATRTSTVTPSLHDGQDGRENRARRCTDMRNDKLD